jgi:adenosylhomocysteine nucleosidase
LNAQHFTVGIVTGLASEVRVLRRLAADQGASPGIACAGASTARARELSRALIAEGAGALMSFGIAGGLDPALAAGTVVLAETVLPAGSRRFTCDPAWHDRVASIARTAGIALRVEHLAGSDRVVVSRRDKAALFRQSGAVAVDMESHGVAEVAAEAGVPFLAVRAIADPAGQDMPRSVLGSVTEAGAARPLLVMGRLCLRPWEVPDIRLLRRNARAAHRALAELGALAPVLFGGV